MFANQLLIAMPNLANNWLFSQGVIYVCEHSDDGAIGIMINHPTDFTLQMILEQLHIEDATAEIVKQTIFLGGPVQQERGFVIHTTCESFKSSMEMPDDLSISTSKECLSQIAQGNGPSESLIALGYSGWGAKQLDDEIKNNVWLTCPVDKELLFKTPASKKWEQALKKLGITSVDLSSDCGHA